MKNQPHLLIVTPTLGESEFLQETLDSIAGLPFQVTHILSCPESKMSELQTRFPGCVVTKDAGRSGGIYGALNTALAHATGDWDWFTYINDDDLLGAEFSVAIQDHLRSPNPAPVLYGNVRLIDSNGNSLGLITTAPHSDFIPAMLQQQISPLNQQGMIFHRKCVDFLRGFDLQYKLCADLDFWARALAGGFKFAFRPLEVGQFRVRPGQLSGNVALTRNELLAITQRQFPKPASLFSRIAALLVYRIYNLPRYIARIRKVGIKTSEAVLAS